MNILVTGGAGFIGSHIVDALIERGHRVTVFDNLSSGKEEFIHPEAVLYLGSVEDRSRVATVMNDVKPDVVFHCAAQINVRHSVLDPVSDATTNILGSLICFEEAVHTRVKKVIFVSTGGAMYGDDAERPTPETILPKPHAPYAVAKLSVESYLHYYASTYGMRTLSLRLGNVYGPRQNPESEAGVVSIFLDALMRGHDVTIYGDGQQTRDFVYVEDVVNAALLGMDSFGATGVYNIGTGTETSVNTILQLLQQHFPNSSRVQYAPARGGEKRYSSLDPQKAAREFGWRADTSLEEGIALTVKWLLAQDAVLAPIEVRNNTLS